MQLRLLLQAPQRFSPKSRLWISLGIASLSLLLLPIDDWQLRLLSAWTAGLFCFLTLAWMMIGSASPEMTRAHAQRQAANHIAMFLLVICVAFANLFVIGWVLMEHKDTFNAQVELSLAAILGSWLLLHTGFTLHYATFFYRRDPKNPDQPWVGGLEFTDADPLVDPPSYWDFVYFTFTMAMTSQTSDTSIVCPMMRRVVLGHAIVSFFFYSVILALTFSVVSGLL